MLLGKGTALEPEYIRRLLSLGYHSVYVIDELSEDIEIKELISPLVRSDAISNCYDFHENIGLINNLRRVESLREAARNIIVEVMAVGKHASIEFPEIKSYDNYLYLHSVNVAVMGALMGLSLNLREDALFDFALGAMLHDIGKVETPAEILQKPGPLSEDEFHVMKKHPRDGFELLNRSTFIKPRSFTVALQHHEAYDGSGYPTGKKGDEIHIFSRLASVVDIFDALTTDRPYKPRWSFHRTLSFMKNKMSKKLDPAIFELFIKHTPEYPIGAMVILSSGETAIVTSSFKVNKVKVIKDSKGITLDKSASYELNLTENTDIKILRGVEDPPDDNVNR